MVRSIPPICLCCMLLWASTACGPQQYEIPVQSEHGYRVSLHVSDTLIWLGPVRGGPQAAALLVRVRDAQGQPVDGLTVLFSVEPDWTQNAALTPAEARTRNGEARAIFQANTTGVVHVMARVDNVTREAAITVNSRPSPTGGGE
jgi:uncharacterized protein (DUF58 family)